MVGLSPSFALGGGLDECQRPRTTVMKKHEKSACTCHGQGIRTQTEVLELPIRRAQDKNHVNILSPSLRLDTQSAALRVADPLRVRTLPRKWSCCKINDEI